MTKEPSKSPDFINAYGRPKTPAPMKDMKILAMVSHDSRFLDLTILTGFSCEFLLEKASFLPRLLCDKCV